MKLYIVYSKTREDKVENVNYFTVLSNALYYLVGDDPSAHIVKLDAVIYFSVIE